MLIHSKLFIRLVPRAISSRNLPFLVQRLWWLFPFFQNPVGIASAQTTPFPRIGHLTHQSFEKAHWKMTSVLFHSNDTQVNWFRRKALVVIGSVLEKQLSNFSQLSKHFSVPVNGIISQRPALAQLRVLLHSSYARRGSCNDNL